jgi:hypothetical protein
MVTIEDPIVFDRMKPFKPDEIRGLIFGVADYSKIIPPDSNTYANEEYDSITSELDSKIRREASAEADKMKLERKEKGDFIKSKVAIMKEDRAKKRTQVVE